MSIARRCSFVSAATQTRGGGSDHPRTARRSAWRSAWARACALALVGLLHSSVLVAGGTGTNMPWNAPLQNLLNNLTGPTARAVVGIGVALCGVIWMMKRHEEGAGRLGQAVVGGALVFGAQVFVGAIGFAGALV